MKAAELRDLAIAWLASEYPGSIIVTELSVSDWGGALIDVAAITETEIVGVEIKGEGDSPSRLELQGHVYGRVARRMWLLADVSIQEKCFAKCPGGWGRLEVWEGAVRPLNRAKKQIGTEKVKATKANAYSSYERPIYGRDDSRYDPDTAGEERALCPWSMCGTLWRDELYDIARLHRVKTVGRANVLPLTEAITNQLPMPVIHAAMIDQLRRRIWRKPVIDNRQQSEKRLVQKAML
jgi:hypothetical protein